MVVCKCRKATKLYCFVHKVPVCGECICFPEHQVCAVRTYSEWVIDGDYDWPPNCCKCNAPLADGTDPQTTRLGCLHVIHTNCLISQIKSFPQHTAPAGYVCPACSTPIWPPKNFKDSGSRLHSKLKEAVMQTGLEMNVVRNHPTPLTFTSDPLKHLSGSGGIEGPISEAASGAEVASAFLDINGSSASNSLSSNHEPNYIKAGTAASAGATTRKGNIHVERQNSEISYFADDDEDGNRKKYTRRGPFRHKFLRALVPFWSSALPTLPVTAPSRNDALYTDDVGGGRLRQQRSSRMDTRKILLFIAILACMATMGILYYRISQGGLGKEITNDEQL
ncbi:hypothetical protein vseg_016153 [Gypsophila vaccaria]